MELIHLGFQTPILFTVSLDERLSVLGIGCHATMLGHCVMLMILLFSGSNVENFHSNSQTVIHLQHVIVHWTTLRTATLEMCIFSSAGGSILHVVQP